MDLAGTYRLPAAAAWEYAARAATTGDRYGNLDAIAWYGGDSGDRTHPVGRTAPNAWGLYDMLGNGSEWAHGNTGQIQLYREGGSFTWRPRRGGSYYWQAVVARAPSRRSAHDDHCAMSRSFRLAKDPD